MLSYCWTSPRANTRRKKKMRIYSVIDGEKKLMNEFPTDAPVSINVDVYAVNEGQLEMQIKNESLNKSL